MPASPAKADETPEGQCSLRLPFGAIEGLIDDLAAPLVTDQGAGWEIKYAGSHLALRLDDGDPDSSDGDSLRLSIGITVKVLGAEIASYSFHADFTLRQTPIPVSEMSCRYGRVLDTQYYDVAELRLCTVMDPPESCVPWGGQTWYRGVTNSILINKARNRELLAPGVVDVGHAWNGCHTVFFVDCFLTSQYTGASCATQQGEKLAILCERKTIVPEEVTLTEADFPGPKAEALSNDVSPFLLDIPRVKSRLESLGILDQVDLDGTFYSSRCYLQMLLRDGLGSILRSGVDVGGARTTFADLILAGGGIRVSQPKQSLFLLIPNLRLNLQHESAPACSPRPPGRLLELSNELIEAYSDSARMTLVTFQREILSDFLDFPKVASHIVEAIPLISGLGLSVYCDHGRDCSQRGGDSDLDGFCDDEDLCPTLPTSVNCDFDGDGHGDGLRVLTGAPGLEPGCFSTYYPAFTQAGPETRQRLVNFACGGCDNCPSLWNPSVWLQNDGIERSTALPIQIAEQIPGALPVSVHSWQPDLDNDWVGDACDPDTDGDGIRDIVDCEPLNPHLALDADRDGVCEARAGYVAVGPTEDPSDCLSWCDLASQTYRLAGQGPLDVPYIALSSCRAGCFKLVRPDNCAPAAAGSDSWCVNVHGHCIGGDARPSLCTPEELAYCSMQYSNPLQEDTNQNGLGDRCELIASGLTLVPSRRVSPTLAFGPGASFGCLQHGETYGVRMRTYGGRASWNEGAPAYQANTRTAFEVGTCACVQDPYTSLQQGNLDWLEECWHHTCPSNTNNTSIGEEDQKRRKYWSPISEPAYVASHPNGCSDLDCDEDALNIAQSAEGALVYGRVHAFTRDDDANLLNLRWDWRQAREVWWPEGTAWADSQDLDYRAGLGAPQKSPLLVSRARATWPSYRPQGSPPISYDYEAQVSYSQATLVEHQQGQCFGEVYLGPPFVLKIIPGVVDLWGGVEAWIPGGGLLDPAPSIFLLGRSPATEELLLHRYGGAGMELEAAQRFLGAELHPLAQVSATVAALPGSLPGVSSGRHEALLLFQKPMVVPSEDPTHGGTALPARLLLGRLSEGEQVTLEDMELVSGQPAPALRDGLVALDPQAGAVFVLGREGSSGRWSLARFSLETRLWSAPRGLPLEPGDEVLSVALDPVTRRLLLLAKVTGEGAVAAPEPVMKALWLDPTTLAITSAAPPAPQAALRDRVTAWHDPILGRVILAGGESAGAPLADIWLLDLVRETWTQVSSMPVSLSDPMVRWDSAGQMLWLAAPRTDVAGLDLYSYSPATGEWAETPAPLVPTAPEWPVDGTFVRGRAYSYPYQVASDAPLPGVIVLGQLTSEAPYLSLELASGAREVLSRGEPQVSSGDILTAALCPPGALCSLDVKAIGGGTEPFVPFALDAREATIAPDTTVPCPAVAKSLGLRGDRLYLVGPAGVRILRASTLEELGWPSLPGLFGAQAGEPCGSHLCVVRPGPNGFMVVDVSRPTEAAILGSTRIDHPVNDLAVWGHLAFLAQGRFGVRILDLRQPTLPRDAGSLGSDGQVISVAVRDGLLAAAERDGTVRLWDVRGPSIRKGLIQASFRISRARFVAGLLFLLDSEESRAEVFRVTDPEAPERLGSFTAHALALTTGLWRGTRLYSLGGQQLKVLRAEGQE
ncbi:MAG: kelch repeat-containing protein [Polyangia bacterium]|jgi:hypothetical protein|nr:kelch repeat-containing protein [Polyangia bacterium]